MKKPKCMTDDEFEKWEFWNDRLLDNTHNASTPCMDCTDEFKAAMLARDRCQDQRIEMVIVPPLRPAWTADSRQHFRRMERKALKLVAKGMSQSEAARRLDVAASTVSKWVCQARVREAEGTQ